MFRLATFGGLSLAGRDGGTIAVQRLRLALLTLLAQGDRGLSRDKLLGLLWAESPPDSARHKLEQALYMLRRQLDDALFIGTDPVRLNPEILRADVTDFEQALKQGDLATAVSLYRGPFLDGFYVGRAEEFERWTESERSRLAQQYRLVLEQLATRADAAGEPAVALGWWRKLAAEDPLSSRATMGVMRALAASGDRPAALRQAEIYDQLVRDELESDPDPAVLSLVEELRAPSAMPVRSATGGGKDVVQGIAALPPPAAGEPQSWPVERHRSRLALTLPAAGAAAVLLALTLRHQTPTRATTVSAAAHRIVIVPFQVATPDSSLTYLREGMVDLLAAKLTGEVGPTAVDPRTTLSAWRRATSVGETKNQPAEVRLAHAVGAGQILQGDVVQVSEKLVLSGTVRGTEDQRVRARATVSGPADSLLELVDRLAASLLVLQAGEGGHRLALLTSTSLPALRAYLDGRAAYRRGESSLAMQDYARALELDSTFALSALELVISSGWVFTWNAAGFPYRIPLGSGGLLGDPGRYQLQWIRAMDLAWRSRRRLSSRDLALLTALRGPRYPEGRRARELLDTWWQLARATPDRADTWYLVGYILLYQGPAMGIADSYRQASDAFRRALALDPDFTPPLAGLLEIAAQRGDTAEVRRVGGEYLARDSTGPSADYVRWHLAASTHDAAALRAMRARFDSVDIETLDRIQWTAQMEGIDLEDADRAMTTLIRRLPNDSGYVLFSATMWALNRGRPREAVRIMEDKRKVEGTREYYDPYRVIYGAYWDFDSAAAAESARFIEAHSLANRTDPYDRWRLVHWWLAQGDTARSIKDLRMLGKAWSADDSLYGPPLLASLMLASIERKSELPDLLARADSLSADGCCNIPAFANLLVARIHERAGDLPGALTAIRRQRWYYPPEYLSVTLRQEGRLAALTGDTAGAIAAYRHYLALRSNPEPELRADAERVRRDLEQLERGR
jgi:serine/threonine-protein kinase